MVFSKPYDPVMHKPFAAKIQGEVRWNKCRHRWELCKVRQARKSRRKCKLVKNVYLRFMVEDLK
jgi:hypothetical protein